MFFGQPGAIRAFIFIRMSMLLDDDLIEEKIQQDYPPAPMWMVIVLHITWYIGMGTAIMGILCLALSYINQ